MAKKESGVNVDGHDDDDDDVKDDDDDETEEEWTQELSLWHGETPR